MESTMTNEREMEETTIEVQLLGDTFRVLDEGGWVSIYAVVNPSLMGSGRTYNEAYKDLIQTFLEVKEHFNSTPIDGLTIEAIKFRDWLNDSRREQ